MDTILVERETKLLKRLFEKLNNQLEFTEESLRESESRNRTLGDEAPMGIMVHHEQVIRFVNKTALGIVGAESENEVLGRSVMDFVLNKHRAAVVRRIQCGYVNSEIIEPFEQLVVRTDGSTIPVMIMGMPCLFEGAPAVQVVFADITKLHEVRRSLVKSEALFRAIIQQTNDGVCLLNEDDRCLLVNDSLQAMLGIIGDDLIGDRIDWFGSGRGESKVSTKQGITEIELERRDGRAFIAEASSSLIEVDQAKYTLIVIKDITERRREAQERLTLEKRLRQSQKLESLGLLAGTIAHDFNNLIMNILGNADLALIENSSMQNVQDNLRSIVSTSEIASELLHQLLDYAGEGRGQIETVNLNGLISEMVPLLNLSISKSAEIVLKLGGNIPVIAADKVQMRQLLMNLVINASDALIDSGGTIVIGTDIARPREHDIDHLIGTHRLEPVTHVAVSVKDTGGGMDEETRLRLFDPFFTTKRTGRGLGLATVLGIVRGHGGEMEVSSAPGEGSTFTAILPCSPPRM